MTYQIFLLFEKETEIPVFIGHKTDQEEIVLSRYEKLDVFFGKQLDFLIVEKDIPEQSIVIRVEDIVYETIHLKFPEVKIYRYKDFLDQQKDYFTQVTDLMSLMYKNAVDGNIEEMKLNEEEIKKLLKNYKRGFKRKFSFDQIKSLREKFSGSGNNFWSRKHTDETKRKIGKHLKKKKAIYDAARKKIWADINAKRKGKTWEEIYGPEKAADIRAKNKATREENKLKKLGF